MLESLEERLAALLVGIEDSIHLLEIAAEAETDAVQKAHFQVTSQTGP